MSLAPALSQKQITSQVLRKMRRELPVEMIEMILSFIDYSVKFLEPTSLLYKFIIPDTEERALDKYRAMKVVSKEHGASVPAWQKFWEEAVKKYQWQGILDRSVRYLNNDVPVHFADLKVGQKFNSQVLQAGEDFTQTSFMVAKKNKKSFKIDEFIYEWKKENKYAMRRWFYKRHTIKLCETYGKTDLGFRGNKKMPFINRSDDLVKNSLCGFLLQNLWGGDHGGAYSNNEAFFDGSKTGSRSTSPRARRRGYGSGSFYYEDEICRDAVLDDWDFLFKFYETAIEEEDEPDRYNRTPVGLIKTNQTFKMGDEELKPDFRSMVLTKPKQVWLEFDEEEEEIIFNGFAEMSW